MDLERKKLLNLIRKQSNKIISTDGKQIKSHKKKLRKMNNKLLSTCQSNTSTGTSTGDCLVNSQKRTENFYELEIKVLRKELVSSKESEKASKIQNVNLQRSIRRLTEETSIHKKTSIRLEMEKDALNSKILKHQVEIDNLKQKINENCNLKIENDALKSELKNLELEVSNLKQKICKQKSRRFDFHSEHKCQKDIKIKELNDQLRQQRAKNRDLNHELLTFKESLRKLKEQKTRSKISKQRRSPNKKEKKGSCNKILEQIGNLIYKKIK